jgi:hypothetical protein
MPATPPLGGELRGPASFPLLDRIADMESVEHLAGDFVEPPIVIPVPLTEIPSVVHNFNEVSNALQKAAEVCTLLANQRGLVAESYALITND